MLQSADGLLTIFLAGDVMTGRGIDQIQRHPGRGELRESYLKRARSYVDLAAKVHGPVPLAVPPDYIWGDALAELERAAPVASIVNLETSITFSDEFWPGKAVHYRMHPENIGCLMAAHIDVCALANNHLLDFGRTGLTQTLSALDAAGIQHAGAGATLEAARRPARIILGDDRTLLVFALGSETSGIPLDWAAGRTRSGIELLPDLSASTADALGDRLRALKKPGDLVIASIHWGSNWSYEIEHEEVEFAHRLIRGGFDLVHGHSSHHLRAIELYQEKLILYGCGDLITDYEGIGGHEAYRGDLGAMYLATLSARDGSLRGLRLVPTQMRRLRLGRAAPEDARWLKDTLNRISAPFGTRFAQEEDGLLLQREAGSPAARRP